MPKKVSVPQALSFKDVEDSMQAFSGDSGQNIRKWLEEFEETSEIYGWAESHKIIYAKNSCADPRKCLYPTKSE